MKQLINQIQIVTVTLMTNKSFLLLLLCLSITGLQLLHAQEPSDPLGLDNDAPVDGGLSLLIAGGIGYGVKKVKDNRRNKIADK